jgi:hypothetical protein
MDMERQMHTTSKKHRPRRQPWGCKRSSRTMYTRTSLCCSPCLGSLLYMDG